MSTHLPFACAKGGQECSIEKSGRTRPRPPKLLLLAALSVVGCTASGFGDVAGTVTVDGKPLPAGKITFFDATNVLRTGDVKDGVYNVRRVATGKARVAVVGPPATSVGGAGLPNAPRPNDSKSAAAKKEVPAKYGNYEASGLEIDVKPGSNPYPIELKSH
jgi:hypothetical protein